MQKEDERNDKLEMLRKELRLTRIFCIISSVLTICLLAGVVVLCIGLRPVNEFMRKAEPALEQLEDLDVDTLNTTLEQVNISLEQVDWEQLSDSLGKLDVDAVNEALEGLDTEEFSRALENLNNATDMLKGISEKFGSIISFFGK